MIEFNHKADKLTNAVGIKGEEVTEILCGIVGRDDYENLTDKEKVCIALLFLTFNEPITIAMKVLVKKTQAMSEDVELLALNAGPEDFKRMLLVGVPDEL